MNLFALRDFARLPNPSSRQGFLIEQPSTIAIFDAFPKAKYHFLVLPRLPFTAAEISEREIDSLESLLLHPERNVVLDELEKMADEVVEMVRDEMGKSEGWEWGVNVGFHAVPSMRHLHLHIISDDLISPSFKTKKHYNSFRPDLGFFIHLREVRGWLKDGEAEIQRRADDLKTKESLLKSPLTCFKCGEALSNMPALKRHLEEEFEKEAKEAKKGRE